MRFAELDAVTVDAHGTIVAVRDPVPKLAEALAARGFERGTADIREAFARETGYYMAHSLEGRDEPTLAALRRACVRVFLEALAVDLDADSFVSEYIEALEIELVPGARDVLHDLRARGLELAVVANWDCTLPAHLERLGIGWLFSAVVTSAAAGAAKPEPDIFERALEEVGAPRERALHVGDSPADEEGARAAGMRFVPAPLATAFAGWT